jgi:hypothetical protein
MAEIAIPLDAAPRRFLRVAMRARIRALTAARQMYPPAARPCCFGRMGERDTMVVRGLAAALGSEQRGERR